MATIESRLFALEHRPQACIPIFRVQLADGTEQVVHGYQLLVVPDIQRVHFDPAQLCAQVVIDLFQALHPETEAIADAQH